MRQQTRPREREIGEQQPQILMKGETESTKSRSWDRENKIFWNEKLWLNAGMVRAIFFRRCIQCINSAYAYIRWYTYPKHVNILHCIAHTNSYNTDPSFTHTVHRVHRSVDWKAVLRIRNYVKFPRLLRVDCRYRCTTIYQSRNPTETHNTTQLHTDRCENNTEREREMKTKSSIFTWNIPNILSINFLNLNPSTLRESHIAVAAAAAVARLLIATDWTSFLFNMSFVSFRTGHPSLTKTTTALSSSVRAFCSHKTCDAPKDLCVSRARPLTFIRNANNMRRIYLCYIYTAHDAHTHVRGPSISQLS